MIEGVVRGQEVVVPDARADPEVAIGADDVAGPQLDVRADPGGRIDGVGQVGCRDRRTALETASGPGSTADHDHGGIEAALGKEPLQLLHAAHDGDPGQPCPPTGSGRRPRAIAIAFLDGSGAKMSITWVAPSPAPITATRSTPLGASRGEGRSGGGAPAACPGGGFHHLHRDQFAGGERRQVDAQFCGTEGRGCRRTHALGCRSSPRPWPPPRPGGVFLERLGAREHVRDRLGQRYLAALLGAAQQVARVRGHDVQHRLARLDLGTSSPARTCERSGTCQAVTIAVSLLTSLVGTMTGFMPQPL